MIIKMACLSLVKKHFIKDLKQIIVYGQKYPSNLFWQRFINLAGVNCFAFRDDDGHDFNENNIQQLEKKTKRLKTLQSNDTVPNVYEMDELSQIYMTSENVEKNETYIKDNKTHEHFSVDRTDCREVKNNSGSHRLSYTVLPRRSEQFSSDVKQAREENELIMIEDTRIILNLYRSNVIPKKIYFHHRMSLHLLNMPLKNIELYKVMSCDLKFWCKSMDPALLAFYSVKNLKVNKRVITTMPLTMYCDGFKNTTVLGSVIQSAALTGCEKLYISDDSSSIWVEDVLANSYSSFLYIDIVNKQPWDEFEQKLDDCNIYIVGNNPSMNYLESINVWETEFWNHNKNVLIVSMSFKKNLKEFCMRRNAKFLKTYCFPDLRMNLISQVAIATFEMRKQWDARMSARTFQGKGKNNQYLISLKDFI